MVIEGAVRETNGNGQQELDVITEEQANEKLHQVRKATQHVRQQPEMKMDNIGSRLNGVMLAMLKSQMDVAEVYSLPRVAEIGRRMGLNGGWSLDLTTCDNDGRMWDFNQKDMRNRAIRKLLKDQPTLLIGSPMCTAYSSIGNMNYFRMSKEEMEARMKYARQHLELCV